MRRLVVIFSFMFLFCGWSVPSAAQPFDFIVPDSTVGDSLSTELRRLQTIERDISLEKLNRPSEKLEALVEIGELRLSQGKLEEAERFFEMALEKQPRNMRANTGLAMVNYHSGRYGKTKEIFDHMTELYPLSDKLKEDLAEVRAKLNSTGELGLRIHEDNRGIQEIVSTTEVYFPSFSMPKLSARYRLENWSFKDTAGSVYNRVISSRFEYAFDRRSNLAFVFAPETMQGRTNINGYQVHGVTGNEIMHLAGNVGKASFRENTAAARLGLVEDFATITVFGDLNSRARLTQSFTMASVSDGNTRRRYDTDLLYYITRQGIPLLSIDAKVYQAGYERQIDKSGSPLSYWAPSNYTGTRFALSCERGIGARWWWGAETHLISNSFRDSTSPKTSENGVGWLAHLSYRFETGRIYAEFADTVRDYFRERTLGMFGSVDF